eukprot:scpid111244/ scgid35395/ 
MTYSFLMIWGPRMAAAVQVWCMVCYAILRWLPCIGCMLLCTYRFSEINIRCMLRIYMDVQEKCGFIVVFFGMSLRVRKSMNLGSHASPRFVFFFCVWTPRGC